ARVPRRTRGDSADLVAIEHRAAELDPNRAGTVRAGVVEVVTDDRHPHRSDGPECVGWNLDPGTRGGRRTRDQGGFGRRVHQVVRAGNTRVEAATKRLPADAGTHTGRLR